MRAVLWLVMAAGCWGQCAMCFRNAEAQERARTSAFNQGILVLAAPLAGSFGLVGWLAYRRRARVIGTGGVSDCPEAGEL